MTLFPVFLADAVVSSPYFPPWAAVSSINTSSLKVLNDVRVQVCDCIVLTERATQEEGTQHQIPPIQQRSCMLQPYFLPTDFWSVHSTDVLPKVWSDWCRWERQPWNCRTCAWSPEATWGGKNHGTGMYAWSVGKMSEGFIKFWPLRFHIVILELERWECQEIKTKHDCLRWTKAIPWLRC